MKKANSVITGLLMVWVLGSQATEATRCGGGEGPKPVDNFGYQALMINTGTGVKEFQYHEMSDKLVFRDERDEIRDASAPFLYPTMSLPFAKTTEALSTAVDPLGRYVAIEGKWKALDLAANNWVEMETTKPLQHLYWKGAYLYGVIPEGSSFLSGKKFGIYRLDVDHGQLEKVCTMNVDSNAIPELMPEQSFPDVRFYESRKNSDGTVTLYRHVHDARNCKPVVKSEALATLKSPLKSLHYFENADAYGIHVNHERENFLWLTPGRSCRYFNLGNTEPLIPDPAQTLVVTVSSERGLKLVFLDAFKSPDEARQATIIPEIPIVSLRSRDLILNRGKQLYLAPLLPSAAARSLMQVTFGNR